MLVMSKQIKILAQAFALLLFITLPLSSVAATNVGKVIITTGNVTAVNAKGVERKLKRRSKIFEGDTINVSTKSRAQIRFIDKQLVALKSETIFRIDEYKFKNKQDGNESAAMSLLKGGMRSVTGAIGKKNKKKYKLRTPVATLGVRGTHYVLQLCAASACGPNVEKGLYGSVVEGAVVMKNQAGESQFGRDEFFHVPSPKDPPESIFTPPSVIVSNDEGGEEGTEETTENADAGTTSESEGDTTTLLSDPGFTAGEEPIVTTTGIINSAAPTPIPPADAPFASVGAFAGTLLEAEGSGSGGVTIQNGISGFFLVDAETGLLPVDALFVDAESPDGSCLPCNITIVQGATLSNVGSAVIGGVNVNWGRWSGDSVLFFDNGQQQTLQTDLAFAFADSSTTPAQLSSLTSPRTFNLVGNQQFQDESGATVTGSITLNVDFGMGLLSSVSIGLSGNGRSYSGGLDRMGMMVAPPVPLFELQGGNGALLEGTCSGGACGGSLSLTGSIDGVFIGPAAEGLVGTFGLENQPAGVGVSGTIVLDDMGGM